MELLTVIIFLLTILTSTVRSCGSPPDVNYTRPEPGHDLLRRWYGVKPIHPPQIAQKPYFYPWPATCGYPNAVQPVRYCFKDKRSADNLEETFNMGIAHWGEAMRVSALKIILDPGARGNKHNYCGSSGVATDALMVSDETREGDKAWNLSPECPTLSTVGYRYIPANMYSSPHRHYMRICAFQPDYEFGTKELAARDIAHELGHVIGFQHEHQRPDRDQYLKFRCKYLQGYDEAVRAADIDEWSLFETDEDDSDDELSLSQKMALVCNDEYYADRYFPNALEYISYKPHNTLRDSALIASNNEHSDAFDYASIMIYDSDLVAKTKNVGKNPIMRRDNGQEVWMGGGVNGNWRTTKVSQGDVSRVARLYESGTGENLAAMNGVGWQVSTRVRIRGVEVGVVEGSLRERDEL